MFLERRRALEAQLMLDLPHRRPFGSSILLCYSLSRQESSPIFAAIALGPALQAREWPLAQESMTLLAFPKSSERLG